MLYMVTYGNIYHQYTPVMLAYIPAPWILWDRDWSTPMTIQGASPIAVFSGSKHHLSKAKPGDRQDLVRDRSYPAWYTIGLRTGKSPCLKGKSTISTGPFSSSQSVSVYQAG